jgi:hypothetical protein
MIYTVNYQYLPKGRERPSDDGATVEVEAADKGGFALIPNVGDYVHIDNSTTGGSKFQGKAKSRMFSYMGNFCHVNIVVEETDVDWGTLIKE